MADPRLLLDELAAATKSIGEPREELEKKIYPFLRFLTTSLAELREASSERIDTLEDAMSEFLNNQESMLLPELAQQIVGVIILGIELCKKVAELSMCSDPEQAQRISIALQGMVDAYSLAAPEVLLSIQDVTIDNNDESDEESANGNSK